MTFSELNSRFGGNLKQADWHQHENGGAWIFKDAIISEEAFIGEQAVVWGGTIRGGIIEGGTIWGGTIWGGTIRGGTIWGGTIRGGTIRGGTWKTTPLFLCGSKHSLSNAKPGYIQIGCRLETFDWWLKNGKAFAKENGYTAKEITEYTVYVKLFKKLGK